MLLGRTGRAADGRTVDPHCFALLSDTHVPSDPKKTQGRVNMTDHFIKAVDQVAGLENAPCGAIFCGDLSHVSGLREDYRQFAPTVSKLSQAKIPTHLMMGNHDHIENLYSELASAKPTARLLAGKHVAIVQSPRANWFLLDSLEITNSPPGLLGEKQLKWLGEALDRHDDRPAIVMAHHDPSLAPRPGPGKKKRRTSGLKDGSEMLDILLGRKHVKAFINGHRHRYMQRTYKGLHVIGLPTTAYTGAVEKGAWVLVKLEKTGVKLELHTLDAKNKTNGQKIELTWRT